MFAASGNRRIFSLVLAAGFVSATLLSNGFGLLAASVDRSNLSGFGSVNEHARALTEAGALTSFSLLFSIVTAVSVALVTKALIGSIVESRFPSYFAYFRLGMSRRRVGGVFLSEALFFAGVGAVAGAAVGGSSVRSTHSWLVELDLSSQFLRPVISPVMTLSSVVVVLVAVLAGCYSGYRDVVRRLEGSRTEDFATRAPGVSPSPAPRWSRAARCSHCARPSRRMPSTGSLSWSHFSRPWALPPSRRWSCSACPS
ncbi:FtsX-like permease family protein [Rhodococcus rhodnii]